MGLPNFPYGETVVLHGRTKTGAKDKYGNDVYDDSPTTLRGVPVWARTSSQLPDGDDATIVGKAALLPLGIDVEGIDRLTVAGRDYQIDGEPGEYRSPFTGTRPGVVVNLTRPS